MQGGGFPVLRNASRYRRLSVPPAGAAESKPTGPVTSLVNSPSRRSLSTPEGGILTSTVRSVFYPMGFCVEVETNSPDVMAAARTGWERYPRLSQGAPVRLRITVSAGSAEASRSPPNVAFDAAWMYVDHGPDNRAVACLTEGWGEANLSADLASDADYVRYHFLEPLAYLLLAPRHFAFAHASCVALNGRAIVLCGEGNAGKTCLAFACARRGWTYLSGDATHFLHDSPDFTLVGRPFSIRFRESARDLFPELEAYPAALRPNQRLSIEADTGKLNLATAITARARHLVFLERRPAGAAVVEPIPVEETLRRLDAAVFFGNVAIRRNQRATLRHFASLPSVLLRYSDLAEAEAALRALPVDEA